jgi:hypothetical protein
MPMRYLAVPEMPRRNRFDSIRHWGHSPAEWHAVVDTHPKPAHTVCGLAYTAEAHRTWDQTMSTGRCSDCERLVPAADTAMVGGSRAEDSGPSDGPDSSRLRIGWRVLTRTRSQ